MNAPEDARDWTNVSGQNMPNIAHRHQHSDGRHCTLVGRGWIFANDDGATGWALCLRRHKTPSRTMRLGELLAAYSDGEQHGWDTEIEWLWAHHEAQLLDLVLSIDVSGIQEPVLLGDDGRLWDGHHRIAAAVALCLDEIPVSNYRHQGGANA